MKEKNLCNLLIRKKRIYRWQFSPWKILKIHQHDLKEQQIVILNVRELLLHSSKVLMKYWRENKKKKNIFILRNKKTHGDTIYSNVFLLSFGFCICLSASLLDFLLSALRTQMKECLLVMFSFVLPKVNSIKCFSIAVSLDFPSYLFYVWEMCP